MTDLNNAKQLPKMYYGRHMFPGVVSYHNETILVDADAMKRMAPSMTAKALYVNHQDDDLENIQTQADGYVTDTFYNQNDGWLWSKFIVVSDAGHEAVAKGWSLSNAHKPLQWDRGGTFHNVKFDRKVLNSEFTHLAIVENPRYEDAKIFTPDQFKAYQEAKAKELQNSKTKPKGKPMFKLFKNKKEEVELDGQDDLSVTLKNGKTVSVAELINAANKQIDLEEAEAEKRNQEDADKKAAEEEAAKKAEEEAAAEAARKAEEERQNAKHFDELQNAHLSEQNGVVIDTTLDKTARGMARYGSNS